MTDRARYKYANDDDPSAVQLPAAANATPSIVSPGDVFEADVAEINPDDKRFSPAGENEPLAGEVDYSRKTVAELKAYASDVGLAVPVGAKQPELASLVDAHARANPQPPGASAQAIAPLDEARVAAVDAEPAPAEPAAETATTANEGDSE